jgi:hypothetical protein
MGQSGTSKEAKMAMTRESQKDDVKTIEVEAQGDKGKEVIVRYEIIRLKWKTWSYENVSREWNRSL